MNNHGCNYEFKQINSANISKNIYMKLEECKNNVQKKFIYIFSLKNISKGGAKPILSPLTFIAFLSLISNLHLPDPLPPTANRR